MLLNQRLQRVLLRLRVRLQVRLKVIAVQVRRAEVDADGGQPGLGLEELRVDPTSDPIAALQHEDLARVHPLLVDQLTRGPQPRAAGPHDDHLVVHVLLSLELLQVLLDVVELNVGLLELRDGRRRRRPPLALGRVRAG